MISDSTNTLIYEMDEPNKCKCTYEYREMECRNHPITKAELMEELKKRRDKSHLLTILSKESFTEEAILYRARYYPRVRLITGDLDLVRQAHK